MTQPAAGKLIVLSGPSGVGKSTILRKLLQRFPGKLQLSVSATTRPPRPGETDGEDYFFLSDEEFSHRREQGDFLECVEVFGQGYWYGTLLSEVRPSLQSGKWIILEIDVDGADTVRRVYPEALTIFLRVDSEQELERRLRSRGTESDEAIERRLEVARRELMRADQYDFQVVNSSIDETVDEISDILLNQGIAK